MAPSNREIFAANFRRLMQTKGVNQAEVAKAVKVSNTTVSEWSRGLKYPRIDAMQRLADYFEVPMQVITLNFGSNIKSQILQCSYPRGVPVF